MKRLFLPLVAGLFAACGSNEQTASFDVVPLPQEVELSQEDPFKLSSNSIIAYPAENELLKQNAEFLSEYINQATGYVPKVQTVEETGGETANTILLTLNEQIGNPEGYVLTTSATGIEIAGQTERGVFYGIQTLRKAIPATAQRADILLPAGKVTDEPRFGYRGMHLDVCRHFFSIDFVKEYIDLLAMHNMNTLHWHLTDDQGWRIEIKKYPKLTEVGAWRDRTVIGRAGSEKYDSIRYGGYYTQEQLKEIVEYAQKRYITVIPEVDLPGHMLAVLAAYPELGCTGGPYEVSPDWGVFDDVLCIGNEQAILFLEDVMSELIEIFPSKYIHIGGDEAPRTRWKVCPKCQARIKAEGLKKDHEHTAEDRLQTYCMAHIERFLNARGRQIIGWDEILEGDVAPNATIMSWRGAAGGIKAAQMGHDVIMTPNTFCYFDYYQSKQTREEPFGIGGYLPVETVYSLEPTEGLNEEQAKHILGAQANVWTEYIATEEHVEYMVLPRMAALSEVQWTQPEKKNYGNFLTRLLPLMKLYHRDGLNYAKHVYNVSATFVPDTTQQAIVVTLNTVDNAPIYYTLDGSEPSASSKRYEGPLTINQTASFRALAIRPEGKSNLVKKEIAFGADALPPIELIGAQPAPAYTYEGAVTLVDGMKGETEYTTGEWLGFCDGDVVVIIDLRQTKEVSCVKTSALADLNSWIMASSGINVAVSADKKEFKEVANEQYPEETNPRKLGVTNYEVTFSPVQARYVKVTIKPSKALPAGHAAAGSTPFIFIDEIEVN